MYWTLELASKLEDAPWPASRDELIDYAQRSGAPIEVIENLQEMEDEGELYESIEDIWPDYPSKEDFFFDEEEYETIRVPATPYEQERPYRRQKDRLVDRRSGLFFPASIASTGTAGAPSGALVVPPTRVC